MLQLKQHLHKQEEVSNIYQGQTGAGAPMSEELVESLDTEAVGIMRSPVVPLEV